MTTQENHNRTTGVTETVSPKDNDRLNSTSTPKDGGNSVAASSPSPNNKLESQVKPNEQINPVDSLNLSGNWYAEDYKTVESKGDKVPVGAQMILDLNNSESGKISLTITSNPPASRVANFQSEITMVGASEGKFTFNDDGWGNKGKGTIKIIDGKVEIFIELEKPPQGNWNMFEGTKTFFRISPQTPVTSN